MKAIPTLAILAAVVGIAVWMVRMGRRDYRALRTSPDRTAPLKMVVTAGLGGLVVALPMLAFVWLKPRVLTWVATIYLLAVIAICGWILFRRRNTTDADGSR